MKERYGGAGMKKVIIEVSWSSLLKLGTKLVWAELHFHVIDIITRLITLSLFSSEYS